MSATIMEQIDIAGLLADLAGLKKGCYDNGCRDSALEGVARVRVMKEGERILSSRAKQVILVMWGKVKITQGTEAKSLLEGDHFIVESGEYKIQCAKKSCILAAEFSSDSWDLLHGE